jgi:hypothetical protein
MHDVMSFRAVACAAAVRRPLRSGDDDAVMVRAVARCCWFALPYLLSS